MDETPAPSAPRLDLSKIETILVRPMYAGNIGQCARAMKNMGLTSLRITDPPREWRGPQARAMAVASYDILKNAKVYANLPEAVADIEFAVALTAAYRRTIDIRPFSEVLPKIAQVTQKGRVAIVFGSESHGLTNDEIARCHMAAYLPTGTEFPSINLAQAVMVTATILQLEVNEPQSPVADGIEWANAKDLEGFLDHLRRVVDQINFLPKDNPEGVFTRFRRIYGRAQLEKGEINLLRGILSNIEYMLGTRKLKDPKGKG